MITMHQMMIRPRKRAIFCDFSCSGDVQHHLEKNSALVFVKSLVVFITATIPILFAAVQPWVWSSYGLLMITAFIVTLWAGKNAYGIFSGRHLNRIIGIFLIWTLFQCLPLPFPVLSFFSPTRFDIFSKYMELTGNAPYWETVSYLPANALAWLTFLLALTLYHQVVRRLCTDRNFLKILVFTMIVIGLLEATYGLVQALVPSMGVLWVDYILDYMGNARGTFINRNHFAGFIEMIWPLSLGYTLAMTGKGHSFKKALASDLLNRQALMALVLVVLLLSLLLSRSRAGITGGLIGFITFWCTSRPKISHIALRTRILSGLTLFLLCVYCLAIGVGPIFERFLSIDDSSSRIEIWRDSLLILKDHPLGIGLNNYENVFQVYNQSNVTDRMVTYAHNDYLQLLIETGWIGFFTLIGGFIFYIGKSFRLIRRLDAKGDPTRFFLAVGAFSGIISMAFHSFFDFNLQIPANCLYFVLLMAILSFCTEQVKLKQHTENTH